MYKLPLKCQKPKKGDFMNKSEKSTEKFFGEDYKEKLSREIDGLVLRINGKLREENCALKRKVDILSAENLRLKETLSQISADSKIAEFMSILSNEKAVH